MRREVGHGNANPVSDWSTAQPRNRANVNVSWDKGTHAVAANIHYIGHYENFTNLWVDSVV